MKTIRIASVFMTGLALVCTAQVAQVSTQIPAPAQTQPIALVGGTVHPVDAPAINNGTVLFDGGKIVAVGTSVTIPDNAERIAVTGMHVYPGIFDAHTRMGLTEIGAVRATNDNNETGAINPNVRAEVAVNPESELIPVTRSNGVTTVLSAPSGGVISGQAAVLNLDGWTWEDMTLYAPAGMLLNWPRMTTVTAWWMRDSEEEQIKQRDERLKNIKQAFEDARAYQKARMSNVNHPHDARWDAMIPVLERRVPVIVDADGIQQIQAAVAFAEREGIKIIIMGGYDAPYCADLLKKNDIPVIVDGVNRLPRRRGDAYDDPFTVADRLRRAGIRYCIAGGGGASNVRNLPYEAAKAASYGLPVDEALKAITLYPAEILGVGGRLGSLTAGKDANVIVADGDILEIPTHVTMEFIQGKKIDMTDKQKLLWDKYKEKYAREGITN